MDNEWIWADKRLCLCVGRLNNSQNMLPNKTSMHWILPRGLCYKAAAKCHQDYLIWECWGSSQFYTCKDAASKDWCLKGLSPNNRVQWVFSVGFCCRMFLYHHLSALLLAQVLWDQKSKRSDSKERFLNVMTLIYQQAWYHTAHGET